MSKPSKTALSHRLSTAADRARNGGEVVILVAKLAHVGHMIAELEAAKSATDLKRVVRRNGDQQLHYAGGGRIRFRSGRNPDSIRGLAGVDLFLVDPRVATSTELEQNMALACHPGQRPVVVRPGDHLTIGGIVR